MSAVDETIENENSSRRLSFRQKFWLFGVGLPVLLMITLFAFVVFLPKTLDPTEQKLQGRWEIIYPDAMKGQILTFDHGRLYTNAAPFASFWEADEHSLQITNTEGAEFMTRVRLMLGLPVTTVRYEILLLTDDDLHAEPLGPSAYMIKCRRLK